MTKERALWTQLTQPRLDAATAAALAAKRAAWQQGTRGRLDVAPRDAAAPEAERHRRKRADGDDH